MYGYWTCKQPLRHPLVCTNTTEPFRELSTISPAPAGRTECRSVSALPLPSSLLVPKLTCKPLPLFFEALRKSLSLTLVIVALAQLVAGAKAPQPAVARLAEAACSSGQRAVRWVGM